MMSTERPISPVRRQRRTVGRSDAMRQEHEERMCQKTMAGPAKPLQLQGEGMCPALGLGQGV